MCEWDCDCEWQLICIQCRQCLLYTVCLCTSDRICSLLHTCTCSVWIVIIILRAKLSGAVYCNRSCLFVCVCLWVCYHDNSKLRAPIFTKLHGSVGEGSDRLQLIKSWPSRAPGKGSAAGRNFLATPYYSQRAVFSSLWALFHQKLFSCRCKRTTRFFLLA